MSKAHPRQSTSYQRKMEVRENRSSERKILAAAKNIFTNVHPELELREHRPRIAGIKNKIKAIIKQDNTSTDNLEIVINFLIESLKKTKQSLTKQVRC
jgi:hypothetical protein